MSKLSIPASNSLRFVNRTYYDTTIATPLNRLYPDYEFQGKLFVDYCQKIEKDDGLWVQILTDYSSFKVNLINEAGTSTSILSSLSYITTIKGLNVYELDVDLSTLSGKYYIQIFGYEYGKPYVEFRSESFQVSDEWEDTILIEWNGNSSINDGMFWSKSQKLRVDGRILRADFGNSSNTYNDSNYELLTLRFDPLLSWQIDIRFAPYHIFEKINLGIGHDEFLINGIQFNANEQMSFEALGNTTLYKANTILQMVDYENYSNIEELFGDVPTYEQSMFLINDTDFVLINATDKLKVNN